MSDNEQSRQRLLLLLITLGGFVVGLSASLVGVIAPQIAISFHADSVQTSWLVNSFLLASLFSQLPAGRLADMVGRKRVYLSGMLVYALAGVLCAGATNIEMLLVFRMLQGIGSACVFATGMAALYDIFPREKRGMAGGTLIAGIYFGLTLGPLISGLVSEYFGWRVVFLVPVPMGLLVFAVMLINLKGAPAKNPGARFDYIGAALGVVWTSALVLGITQLPSAKAWPMLAVGVLALVVFMRIQTRSANPLLRLGLFAENKTFALSVLVGFLMYTCTTSSMFLLSFDLQMVLGLSPKYTGFILVVPAVCMAVLARFTGQLSDKIEPRFLCSTGMLVSALGFYVLSEIDGQTPMAIVVLGTSLMGLGFVFFSSPNNNAIMGGVASADLGAAAACSNMARDLGNVIGLAIVALSFSFFLQGSSLQAAPVEDLKAAIKFSFYYCILASLVAGGVSLVRGNARNRAT